MDLDPDLYPTPEDDWHPDDDDTDAPDGDEEWRPGTCDGCSGPPKTDAERTATLASAIVPVCACWAGTGAAPQNCHCG